MKQGISYNNSVEYAAEYFYKAIQETIRELHKKMNFPISHEEYIILETIYLSQGIIQIEIANRILMQRSYVGKLLNKLANMDYIKRVKEIKGKRQVIYRNYLTDKGQELYLSINSFLVLEMQKRTTESQRAELKHITETLINLANKMKKDFNLNF